MDENISGVTSKSKLTVESVAVYWDYNNVIKGVNDTWIHNSNTLTVPEGYWTADMITGIRDKQIIHVNTGSSEYHDVIAQMYFEKNGSGGWSAYSNHSTYQINLGNFGTLLGFDKDTALPPRKKRLSQNPTDLNLGLRYITVSCDMVDETRNIDADGRRGNVIATIPVPIGVDLKRAVTQHHMDTRSPNGIHLQNGCFNNITFDINTNIGPTHVGSILLELCISDK